MSQFFTRKRIIILIIVIICGLLLGRFAVKAVINLMVGGTLFGRSARLNPRSGW